MAQISELTIQTTIENRIFTIRGMQVMVDRDLAELYGVETKVLNQAVKRNIEKKEIYHIGASLKDLGRKWFVFSLLDVESFQGNFFAKAKTVHASFGLMGRVCKIVENE